MKAPVRVVPQSQLPLDATHVRHIDGKDVTFTVSSALESRGVKDLTVIEQGDVAVAYATTDAGGRLEVLGNANRRFGAVYDAVTRLATLATRPEGRD